MNTMENLKDKIAVVVGGGRGIGQSIAFSLASEEAKVICVSRTEKQLKETVEKIKEKGGYAKYYTADVTSVTEVNTVIDKIVKEYGRIDIWVNNAGCHNGVGPTWEIDPQVFKKEIDINLFGVIVGTAGVLKQMVKQNFGRIINTAGGGAKKPLVYGAGYSATKAGVVRFTETVAMELEQEGYNVKIFAFNPGLVKTELTTKLANSKGGRKYLPGVCESLEKGNYVSGSKAGELVVKLAKGYLDDFNGKLLNVFMNIDNMLKNKEQLLKQESFTLRIK